MAVDLSDVHGFVGVGDATYDDLLSACVTEAVDLLRGYVRHLRVLDDAGQVVGLVDAQVSTDVTSGLVATVTWTDTRDPVVHHLVPASVLDRCTLEVTSDLFARRNAPNGVVNAQYATGDGPGSAPVRINRDPLSAAYAMLGRWSVPF